MHVIRNKGDMSVPVSILGGLLLALVIAYFVSLSGKSAVDKGVENAEFIIFKSKLVLKCANQCLTKFTSESSCVVEDKWKGKPYKFTRQCSFFVEVPILEDVFYDEYKKNREKIGEECYNNVAHYEEKAKAKGLSGEGWSNRFNGFLTNEYGEKSYAYYIYDASKEFGVDFCFVVGVIVAESGGNALAVSDANAHGIMQLTKGTAKDECMRMTKRQRVKAGIEDCNDIDLHDPRQNIYLGVGYLSYLKSVVENKVDKYGYIGNKLGYLAGSYNAGPGGLDPSVDCASKCNFKVPKFDCTIRAGGYVETQNYIPRVLSAMSACKELGLDKQDYEG